jgi:hypothetical protein
MGITMNDDHNLIEEYTEKFGRVRKVAGVFDHDVESEGLDSSPRATTGSESIHKRRKREVLMREDDDFIDATF